MFKKITRMKELLTIKHNWLYVCIKKDSKYYGKLKNIQNQQYLEK
jgi:hypothetical protein